MYTCYPLISYPDNEQLQAIYSAYLRPVLHHSLSSHPVWGAIKNIQALAHTMVTIYEQVSRVLNRIIKQNKAQNQTKQTNMSNSYTKITCLVI